MREQVRVDGVAVIDRFALLFMMAICLNLTFGERSAYAAGKDAPRIYQTGSYDQIVSDHKGGCWLLVFWSLDCPPCYQELEYLAGELDQYPLLPLVLISTDGRQYSSEIQSTLDQYGLSAVESWVFGDEPAVGLRYQTDGTWRGELPRSYFFDHRSSRNSHSGTLGRTKLHDWLSQANSCSPTNLQ